MIEIAAVVCLMSDTSRCKDVALTFEDAQVTSFACMMYGQSELAKWTGEHPNWRVARWACRPAGQVAKL